ncbi:hypothetical protein A3D11_02965 [Candidatus Peribacteria bacterium RIFCSPHIGHO2_02_FULL_49_16]|nr:MAG: hypothetical protein A2880_01595 [Candidatus Peribacteria bacterium RIFCSPHIGHO2_01_FULL_49_38]OGJ58545.1 MAG: hypothetical protein A3D11_02965 [Candidatus Peribacteria bacterium RIFCSPHIGHO2_02_FULL_49_16]
MFQEFITVIWGPAGIVALISSLLLLFALFALILIPSLARDAAKPQDIGEAMYCYFAQSTGIILMSVGGLPILYSVLTRVPLASLTYSALLFIFAIGGLVFLWHDHISHHLPESAVLVIRTVYLFAWKFIGFIIFLFTLISFVLHILLNGTVTTDILLIHLIVALYGLVLWWTTREFSLSIPPFFHHKKIRLAMLTPSKPEKAKAPKKKKIRRKRKKEA